MEKFKSNEKTIKQSEEMLSEYFADPVDSRFGKHLGERLAERARAMYMERLIRPEKKKLTFGESVRVMAKWQMAFLASFIGVLIVGGGVVMAVPSLREKVLSTFAPKGLVSVASSPSEAEVWVGPVMYGTTPTDIKIKEGSHELKVTKAGFEDYTEIINVVSGETLSVKAVLKEQENPMKYSREETWNLYQDPNLIYQIYFPYDWEYEWEEFLATQKQEDFTSTTVSFSWGETVETSIYYSSGTLQELEQKIECADTCASQTVKVQTTGEDISAEKFLGTSVESGREIMLLLVPAQKVGFDGYLVLESNSQLADEFVSRLKLFTDGIDIDWQTYQNETYGFSFDYPLDWALYALDDETYVQASADGGIFSVTVGGVNTEADLSVKNEDVLIKVGSEIYDATKRYYSDLDYYVIQSNVVNSGVVYGFEIRHEDDKWVRVIDDMFSSFLVASGYGVIELVGDEYGEVSYSLTNIDVATDAVYPENSLRCGDGVMIIGNVLDSNGDEVENGIVKLFVDKGMGDELVGFPVEVNDGSFVIPSSMTRHQLFSQQDSTCSYKTLILKLYGPAIDNLLWSQEFTNLSGDEYVSTGVQGVVRFSGIGVADVDVSVYSGDRLVTSGMSGSGGYFVFSVPAGSYIVKAEGSQLGIEVSEGFVTYVSFEIGPSASGTEAPAEAGDELGGEGTIVGYVHDGSKLLADQDVQILRDGSLYATVKTDSLGRFKAEELPSEIAYTVKVSGKTIVYARWEINIEDRHILPVGGTLRVEVVVQ